MMNVDIEQVGSTLVAEGQETLKGCWLARLPDNFPIRRQKDTTFCKAIF